MKARSPPLPGLGGSPHSSVGGDGQSIPTPPSWWVGLGGRGGDHPPSPGILVFPGCHFLGQNSLLGPKEFFPCAALGGRSIPPPGCGVPPHNHRPIRQPCPSPILVREGGGSVPRGRPTTPSIALSVQSCSRWPPAVASRSSPAHPDVAGHMPTWTLHKVLAGEVLCKDRAAPCKI